MVVYKINEDPVVKTRPVGTIAMCTRDSIKAQTAISWMLTDYGFLTPFEYVGRFIVQGHVLVAQRNEAVMRMEGDWILFIDDDMTWQPQAIRTLVETRDRFDLDIVGGLCFQRNAPYQPTMYYEAKSGGTGYTFAEVWPEDTAVEVDATGMAFCLIHKRVFERMLGEPFPTREMREKLGPPPFFKWGDYGEDMLFCREARETGSRIFVDTSVKVGHIGDHLIDERTFMRELALRSDAVYQVRKNQLGALDKRAMPKREAMRRFKALSDD